MQLKENHITSLLILLTLILGAKFLLPFFSETENTNLFIDETVLNSSLIKEQINKDKTTYHLFSHGRPGELFINGEWKSAKAISVFLKNELNIKNSLYTNINIYGCEFAKGEKGKLAVDYLQKKLKININASTNTTGQNGDWVLEIGKIKANITNYQYNLQIPNSALDEDYDGDNIINSEDLDDDNDGIIDSIEGGPYCNSGFASNFNLVGDAAAITIDEIKITDDQTNQSGAAVFNQKINMLENFSMNLKINFGSSDSTGADGLSLVFHNDPNGFSALGLSGNGIGALGIQDGIVIEFDDYNNGGGYDIANDHSSIWDSDGPLTNTLVGAIDLGNFEDGLYHDIEISWTAAIQNLKISFDAVEIININNDLITNYFNSASEVYFMIAGSTGGFSNLQTIQFECLITESRDTDNDGLPDYLDLDSDGDGCPDATEGGNNYTTLTPSSLPGGNNGMSYTGYSNNSAQDNLGNNVNTTGANIGIPIITESGQSIGTSEIPGAIVTSFDAPTNISICNNDSPNQVTFTSSIISTEPTNALINYQWQLSTDNGGTFSDINGESGSTSSGNPINLLVSGIDLSFNGYLYKIIYSSEDNSCPEESQAELIVYAPPVVFIDEVDPICVTEDPIQLTGIPASGGSFSGIGIESNNTFNPFIAGVGIHQITYSFTGTNNCTSTASKSIEVLPEETVSIVTQTSPKTTCEGEYFTANFTTTPNTATVTWIGDNGTPTDLSDDVTGTGDIPNQLLSNPTSNNIIYTYHVFAKSPNGCNTEEETIEVIVKPKPEITASICSLDICSGEEAIISFSSTQTGTTYNWSSDNGTTSNTSDDTTGTGNISQVLTNTTSSIITHTFTVIGELNGCNSNPKNFKVDVFPNPTANAGDDDELTCAITTLTLSGNGTGQGALSYEWITTDGNILSGNNTNNPLINAPGNYTLTVTDADNGCTQNDSVTISQDIVKPTANAGTDDELTCAITTLTLSGNGAGQGTLSYEWITTDGNIVSGNNTNNPLINAPGTYTLTVTDADNGCTQTDSVTITQDIVKPTANAGNDDELTCAITTLTLSGNGTGQGTLSYEWITTDGNIVSGNNTSNPLINAPGTYTLTVTDADNGCTQTDSVTITQDIVKPTANAGTDDELTCAITILTLSGNGTGQGTLSYEWTTTDGNIVSGNNTSNPLINSPGTYTLTVTDDDNGCTQTDSVTITQDIVKPTANAGTDDELTCTITTLTLSGSGTGQGSLSYEWITTDGNIVSGNNTNNPLINAPGNYILTVTDADNGCTQTDSVTISEDIVKPTANAGDDDELTCTITTLTLSGNGTGQGTLSYEWTTTDGNIVSGNNTSNPLINSPGTYTLTVTDDDNDCTQTDSVTITQDIVKPTANAGDDDELTCAITTLTLNGNGTGQGTLSFEWITTDGNIVSGNNTSNPLINAPGTYTLTVTDADNGCTQTDSVTITQDIVKPTANAGTDDELTCAITILTLSGNGTGQGTLSYEWTTTDGNIVSGNNTSNPLINSPGTYTLTVTDDDNGCTQTDSVTITQDIVKPTANAGDDDELTCTITTLTLSGNGTGQGTLSYEWTTTDGNIVSGNNTSNPLINSPGTYTLTVTDDDNDCTQTDSVTITQDIVKPTANAGDDDELTCAITTLTLNGNGTGQGTLSFEWITTDGNIISGNNTNNPLINAPGNYTLTVTDADNGCTQTDSVTISQDIVKPTANAGDDDELTCAITTLTLSGNGTGQGTLSYEWTTTDGNILSGNNTNNPLINAPGTYTLTVTDADNGCTQTDLVTITQDIVKPTANAGTDDELTCTITTLTLSGSGTGQGSLSYEWITTDGNIVSGNNTNNPLINAPGTYTLTVTDADNGCTQTDSVTITQDIVKPTANAGNDDELTCAITTLTLSGNGTGQGTLSYEWTTTDGNIVSGNNTNNPLINAPGTYTLTVTDADNGCTQTDSATISQDIVKPTANAGDDDELTCAITTLTLNGNGTGQGALSYEWITTDGNILSGNNTNNPLINAPGNYTLTVTDADNGCTQNDSVTISQDIVKPTANAGTDDELTCAITTLTLSGNGAGQGTLSYEWITTDGNIVSGNNTNNPLINAPGTYTLTVTDADNGCTQTDSVTITQDIVKPTANAGDDDELTCAITTLTLNGNGTGQGTLSFEWITTDGNIVSGNNTSNPLINAPGTYTLTVTDADNGCTQTDSVTITQDIVKPTANAGTDDELTCAITILTLSGNGTGQGTLSYEWTTTDGNIVSGNNTSNPLINSPGTYTLTVTDDDNGCTQTDSVTITQDIVKPTANAGTDDELTCTITTLTLSGSGTGQGSLSYEWITTDGNIVSGNNTNNPLINAPGNYILTVTDADNGCTQTDLVTITQDIVKPTANAGTDDELTCTITTLTLSGSGTGQGSLSYEWITTDGNIVSGNNTNNPLINAPGTYTLTVTDADNGCTQTDSVTITQDIVKPTANAGNDDELTCAITTLTLSGNGTGQGTLSYEWTTTDGNIISGNNTNNPLINAPGTYTLTVTDADNGCTQTDSATISQDIVKPTANAGDDDELTCAITTLTLNGNGTGQGTLSYEWTTTDGNIVSGNNTNNPLINAPGNYTLTVTDADNGCTQTDSVIVTVNTENPIANAGNPFTKTCTQHPNGLEIGTTNSTNYTYSWTPNTGLSDATLSNPIANPDSTTTYLVTVTDIINGCTNTDSVTVTVNTEEPIADAGNNQTINCITSSPIIGTTNNPNYTYAWSPTSGLSNPNIANPTAIPTSTTTYTLLVTDTTNGCTNTDEVTVYITPPHSPEIIAPKDIILEGCRANATTVTATNSGFAYSENLTPLTLSQITTFLTLENASINEVCEYSITYFDTQQINDCNKIITRTFTITNSYGLSSTDTQQILMSDTTPPTFLQTIEPSIVINCNTIPEPQVLAAIDKCTIIPSVTFNSETTIIDSENYIIERTWVATDDCDNQTTVTQLVYVKESHEILNETLNLCISDNAIDLNNLFNSTTLPTSNSPWILNETNTETTSLFSPNEFGLGQFELSSNTNENGCTLERIVSITVHDDCMDFPCITSEKDIIASTLVTPNGDHINDTFKVDISTNTESKYLCDTTIHLEIYSRWGALIYKSENYKNDWSGEAPSDAVGTNNKLPKGTYFYIIKLTKIEIAPIQGYFLLGEAN